MRNFLTNQRQIPDEVILFPTSLVTEEPSGVNPGAQQPRQTHPPTVNPTRTRSQVQETEQTSNSCLNEPILDCLYLLMYSVLVLPIFILFCPVWIVLDTCILNGCILNGEDSETTSDNRPHVVVIPLESPWQQTTEPKPQHPWQRCLTILIIILRFPVLLLLGVMTTLLAIIITTIATLFYPFYACCTRPQGCKGFIGETNKFMERLIAAVFDKYIVLIIKLFYRNEENTDTLAKCCRKVSKFVKYVAIGLVSIVSYPVLYILGCLLLFFVVAEGADERLIFY